MDATAVLAMYMFIIIFMIGVPGNTLVVWVFARKSRRTSTAFLIISLAFVDLAACLVSPVHLMRALGGQFINGFICKCSIFGSRVFSFSALYLTTYIAIDRYMAICRPLQVRSKTQRIVVILVSVGLAFWGNFQYVLFVRPLVIGTVTKCIYKGGPDWLDFSNEIFTSTSFLFAFFMCSCAYIRIYLQIRKQMKVRAAMGNDSIHQTRWARRTNRKHTNADPAPSASTEPACGNAQDQSLTIPHKKQSTRHSYPETQPVTDNTLSSVDVKHGETRQGGLSVTLVEQATIRDQRIQSRLPSGEFPSIEGLAEGKRRKSGGHRCLPSNGHRLKKEYLMTRMLLGTNLILVFSWLPSFILTNVPDEEVTAFRGNESKGIVVYLSYQLRTLNHIVSIFVYVLLNEHFRRDCAVIFRKCSLLRRNLIHITMNVI